MRVVAAPTSAGSCNCTSGRPKHFAENVCRALWARVCGEYSLRAASSLHAPDLVNDVNLIQPDQNIIMISPPTLAHPSPEPPRLRTQPRMHSMCRPGGNGALSTELPVGFGTAAAHIFGRRQPHHSFAPHPRMPKYLNDSVPAPVMNRLGLFAARNQRLP